MLTLKVNIKKFKHNIGDYPEANGDSQTAHIRLKYKNKECMTNVLPTDIPITSLTEPHFITMRLTTRGLLGDCWNLDVSSGSDKMVIKLKLPVNSPIAVSKVKVIDDRDHNRCWTSYWRDSDSNYNKQSNQWVVGKAFFETVYGDMAPALKNNFNGDCAA